MYRKNDNYSLDGSCSALSNNLCLYKEVNEKLCCVHKSSVNVMTIKQEDGSSFCHLVPLKESSVSSLNSMSLILQAKWVKVRKTVILVIASERGIQVFDQNGKILLYWYAFPSDGFGDSEGVVVSTFARGITGCGDNLFCVGTYKGDILTFQFKEGNLIDLLENLQGHDDSITDLNAEDNRMVSGDDDGVICLWECEKMSFKKITTFVKFNCPCTSLSMWKDLILAAFASGHLRVFHQHSESLIAEVTAHARWINAVDIAAESGLALSVSEDSFVRVWKLENIERPTIRDGTHMHVWFNYGHKMECERNSACDHAISLILIALLAKAQLRLPSIASMTKHVKRISHKFSCHVADTQLCGGCFKDASGQAFYITGYDLNEVIKFSI